MTTKRWILLLLLLLVMTAGHVFFHYKPRARPSSPNSESAVAALLTDPGFPAAVWVPYPHQNLIHLRRVAGAQPASLRAVARLAGLPAPALPTFGPLELPPSSEIAVAADDLGERFVVRARVYPMFAAFAKLAGRLASNPWLQGGEILVEGRQAQVSWDGNLWTVASSDMVLDPATGELETAPPGLAWIQVRQAVDPLPAGLYRLFEDPTGLAITSHHGQLSEGGTHEPPALGDRLDALGVFLLVYAGRHEALGEPSRGLAFFDQDTNQPGPEGSIELPRIASLYEPGGERWSLPGESLLEIAGSEPKTAQAGTWGIAAIDSPSLERAMPVGNELDRLLTTHLSWGLWLDLGGGLAEVDRIADVLSNVPIAPRRQVERWKDARQVLAPLAERYSYLIATVTEEPRTFELRLELAEQLLDSPPAR